MTSPKIRILVTGTRGKSTAARLLWTLLHRRGLAVWGRSTGTRALSFEEGTLRQIRRTSPASVEEMRWWLRRVPPHIDAVVLENSAVHPDLQPLASRWLRPTGVIWTNALEDHQELWGPGASRARTALLRGIPSGVPVFLGASLKEDPALAEKLAERGCSAFGPSLRETGGDFRRERQLLLELLWKVLDLPGPPPEESFPEEPPSLLELPRGILALGFEANDPASTRLFFEALHWPPETTRLWYHHRRDRPGRLEGLEPFLALPWKERILTGCHALKDRTSWNYRGVPDTREMIAQLEGPVMGCGNVKGLPLDVMNLLERKPPCPMK